MTQAPPNHRPAGAPAIALVVTLMMMSVLTMMVVGLAAVMRNEHGAARNLTYQVLAEQLADASARQAMAALLAETPPAGTPSATGPGWIQSGNRTRYLVSPATPQSQWDSDVKNLERIGTNSLILDSVAGVYGGIFAGWTNLVAPDDPATRPIGRSAWWVDDEGTKLNLNAVGSNNTNLFLPYLTRGITGSTNTNEPPTFALSADWVFADASGATNATNAARAQALRQRTRWLPTPESLKSTNFLVLASNNLFTEPDYQAIKGRITTWSSNMDLTPWGAAKVNLADGTATLASVRGMLGTNAWGGYFMATLADKYGSLFADQIAANILSVASTNQLPVPSYDTSFSALSTNRHRQNLPLTAVGQHPGPYLNEVRLLVDQQIPTVTNATVRLNVGVQIFNPHLLNLSGYSLEVRPRKLRFEVLLDPASLATNLAVPPSQPSSFYRALVRPDTNFTAPIPLSATELFVRDARWTELAPPTGNWKPTSYWIGPEWNENGGTTADGDLEPFPTNRPLLASLTGSANYQDTVVSQTIAVSFGNAMRVQGVGANAFAMLDQVILRRSDGRVVDWVSLDDFSQAGNYFDRPPPKTDNGQITLTPVAWTGPSGPAYAALGTEGLKKTDPQVRFPNSLWDPINRGVFTTNGVPSGFSARAWSRVTDAFDCTSTSGVVTGVPHFWPDPVTNGSSAAAHAHFVPGFLPTNGIRSVAQLGAIHTGLPWRTLRLQFQPEVERSGGVGGTANYPPDWILLDAFTAATNPSLALPRINPNGLVTSLLSNSASTGAPLTSGGQRQTRRWAVLSALGALRTNQPVALTNAMASNGIPVSLSSSAAILDPNRLVAIANNLAGVQSNPLAASSWAANSGWPAVRGARANNFPAYGIGLSGEFLEVRGVTDDGAAVGEDVVEGRLRGFMDMLTTRSDTFSVWSIGQGLVVVTNAAGNPIRTNVMGEVRKQTVFQREPILNGGVVTGYRIRTLYTRNHVVDEN